jgi:hypothetical protein
VNFIITGLIIEACNVPAHGQKKILSNHKHGTARLYTLNFLFHVSTATPQITDHLVGGTTIVDIHTSATTDNLVSNFMATDQALIADITTMADIHITIVINLHRGIVI